MKLEEILKELNTGGYTKLDPNDKEKLLNYIERLENLIVEIYGKYAGRR